MYAPLVGLAFDANVPEGLESTVTSMPANQTEITYDGTATEPTAIPQRTGYTFAGWYKDPACTEEYDFDTKLTDNWTMVYAKWEGTGSLVVTKRTVDAFDEPLTLREGATFYVQLFADEALTEKVGEKQPIVFDGTSSAAQVVFSKLENGTYYVAEVDEEDNIISAEQIGIYDGGEYYPMYPDGNAGTLEGDTANAEISFNNVFLVLPQEYYKSIDLNITKQVRNTAGQPAASDETFYAGIFTDEKYTQLAGADLVEQNIVPIAMNGSSDQTVTVETGLFGNEETVKFYITEVNASGVPVGDDFGYIMTIQNGTLEMNGTSESQQITITNTVKTQGSTVTDENGQGQNGTGTDSSSGSQTNNNNSSSSSSSNNTNNTNRSTSASRTGDSTRTALYAALLGICLAVAIVYGVRSRREE